MARTRSFPVLDFERKNRGSCSIHFSVLRRKLTVFTNSCKKSNFVIRKTSVAKTGRGLYCRNKGYTIGKILPFSYPGIYVNKDKIGKLNDRLFELSETCENEVYRTYNTQTHKTEIEISQIIAQLNINFGITIVKCSFYTSDSPNWVEIYDRFIEYLFAASDDCYAYWPYYDWESGNIIPNPDRTSESQQQRENMHKRVNYDNKSYGLFINEPPPYDYFYNVFSKQAQAARPNVVGYLDLNSTNNKIKFRVIREIRPNDEILISYGPYYNRDYEINMSGMTLVNLPESNKTQNENDVRDMLYITNYNKAITNYKSKGILYDSTILL